MPEPAEGDRRPRSWELFVRASKTLWGSRLMSALITGAGAALVSLIGLLLAGVISFPGGDDATKSNTTTGSNTTVRDSPYGPSYLLSAIRIGDYKVHSDGSSEGANAAFGDPSDIAPGRGDCTMTWKDYGIRIVFYNLGGFDPCKRGRFCRAHISEQNWRTTAGLQIGESVRRLQKLYPTAQEFPSGGTTFWALEPPKVSACGRDARQGGLNAVARDGKIVAFTVSSLEGGD
jgi:hypothetical protein